MQKSLLSLFAAIVCLNLAACTHTSESQVQAGMKVSQSTVSPGTSVTMAGKKVRLYPGTLRVGDNINDKLAGMKTKGKVTIINVVPSVDTPVCEAQTHELGESKNIPSSIHRVTVSRDLPMAQERFAREAKLTNIEYVSDYKFAKFGKSAGLLMQGPELLARGVIVVDKKGIVRYIQVVPEITELPNLDKAISAAKRYL